MAGLRFDPKSSPQCLAVSHREVLNLEMAGINAVRAKRPQYLPTVLTKQEAIAIIQPCDGICQRVVKLLYRSELRLINCLADGNVWLSDRPTP